VWVTGWLTALSNMPDFIEIPLYSIKHSGALLNKLLSLALSPFLLTVIKVSEAEFCDPNKLSRPKRDD
jgi:hypothetical protein